MVLSSPHPVFPLLPTPASFTLSQALPPVPPRAPPIDIRSHPEFKRKTWTAKNEGEEGELAISVSGGWVRLLEETDSVGLAPIQVQVDYRVTANNAEGIVFSRDHMYISPSNHDAARMWTPCIDSLWERCTWELIFIAPAHIDDLPVTVVSSGELIEQTTHPHASSKVIFSYLQANPTSVQHVAFAAGPFEMHSIAESPRPIIGFCLPGDLGMMIDSTITLQRAMEYVTTEYGSYPFTDFKAVFVADPRANVTSATLAILSSDLLSPPSVIDQVIESRQIISHALITQWIGINVIQRSLSDTWVTNGLALYLSSLFLRHELGNNEYRFRLKKDIDRCVRLDQGDQWPICVPGSTALDSDFVNLKAPLVMHVLDRHIAKAGTSLGLSRVIPRILLSALSDELPGNTLSTPSFFRTCRKTSGLDLQAFQDQWVYGSGCPHLRLTATFVRKKFQVEFTALQTHPGGKKRPSRFFEGSLTVRIHEADGAPFEHLLDIKQPHKTFTLPFNTKYKRTRRSGHIAAKFQVHDDDPEENQLQDSERAGVFTYPPWEDELERQEWRVAEWDSDQAATMLGEGGGYEWIRVDPECEWLASFEFTEKPWYWISQLQGDRDVVAQLEVITDRTQKLTSRRFRTWPNTRSPSLRASWQRQFW